MIYAIGESGERIEPSTGRKAKCPACREEVIAKCGSINRWHWSHRADTDCDPWSEHEGPWHLAWKEHFLESEREVVIGPHRADIRTVSGRVIELQHSPISAEEIEERERFYGPGMVWLVDASEFIQNIDFCDKGDYFSFRWKWPRKTWAAAKRPVFLDPGDESDAWHEDLGNLRNLLFHMKKMSADAPCGGWGMWGQKDDWLQFYSTDAFARYMRWKAFMEVYHHSRGEVWHATC